PQSGQSRNVERLEDRVNADPVAAAGCNAKGARPVAQPRQIAGPTGAAESGHNNSQPSNEHPRSGTPPVMNQSSATPRKGLKRALSAAAGFGMASKRLPDSTPHDGCDEAVPKSANGASVLPPKV